MSTFAFDAGRALDHVQRLSFPRRVGTHHERRAAHYVARALESVSLEVEREPFAVSRLALEVGFRLVFALTAVLIISGGLLAESVPLLAALFWGVSVVVVNSPWRLIHLVRWGWPTESRSENLIATLPGNQEAPARVVFMAHYDSKSQLLPTGIRVALVTGTTLVAVLLALAAGLAGMGLPWLLDRLALWHLVTVCVVFLAILVANFSGNRSPGALDNASGVAALLEMARTWRPREDAPLEVYWVSTGCEELALDGARHFLRRREQWWLEKPTLLINLESVGAGDRLLLAGERETLPFVRGVARALGLPHKRLRVLGAGMDHEPYASKKLPSVSILGDVIRFAFALHSARDNTSRVQLQALERASLLAAHVAWSWGDRHRPASLAEWSLVAAEGVS